MSSYAFTFAVLLAVMTNTCQHCFRHRPKKPDCWGRWGPFVLMVISTVLLLASPLKNLAVNVCMASFHENGFDTTIEHVLDVAYLPVFGTMHMQAYTSVAYLLMLWGTGLQVDVSGKFKASLKTAQGTPAAAQADAKA
mmetsp:Transcript_40201/g.87862  ORF Transcript_40201/g.87862 Transcript_40201/m.87862 type:complete len:138 (+) Transcript_40201:297-710(+)